MFVRILVVDSYGRSGAALARLLQLHGHEARWARTVAGALSLCNGQGFDVLITDLQLPDGSGAHLLADLVCRHHVKAISLSSDGSEESSLASHQAGFAAHFVKPISFDVLCDTISSLAPVS